jgi:hypothetical protein
MARGREEASQAYLESIRLDHPAMLRRQLRSDLATQADLKRLKRSDDQVVHLTNRSEDILELICPAVEFSSESKLEFKIEVGKRQEGWLIRRFQFSLYLAERRIKMVRIHLNERLGHDPVRVPRCHLHLDNSNAHIPFPVMSPRLMVHLICEHIEPDLGL